MSMLQKCVAFTRPDGGVSVGVLAEKGRKKIVVTPESVRMVKGAMVRVPAVTRDETDDEFMTRFIAGAMAQLGPGVTYEIMDTANVPADRSYRNAWKANGKIIDHDMQKARELHREKIRVARDGSSGVVGMWQKADAAVTRALATGNQAAATAAETVRQQMRDAPNDPAIDAAATIDDLKKVWPLPKL